MKALIIISVLLVGSMANTKELDTVSIIHKVKDSNFESIEIKKSPLPEGGIAYEIYGKLTYANDCMVKDFKFKRIQESKGQLFYDVFGAHKDEKVCIKIFQPVTRTYLIDTIYFNDESEVPEIFVNNKKAN